jgi:hypothetical protein
MDSSTYKQHREPAYLIMQRMNVTVRMLVGVAHSEDAAIEKAVALHLASPHCRFLIYPVFFDSDKPSIEIPHPKHAKDSELEL